MAGRCNVGAGHGGSLAKCISNTRMSLCIEIRLMPISLCIEIRFIVYRDTRASNTPKCALGFRDLRRRRNTFLTRVLLNTVRAQAREVRLRGECPARCRRHLTAHPEPHAPCLTTKEPLRGTVPPPKLAPLAGGPRPGRPLPSNARAASGSRVLPGKGQAVPISPNVRHPGREPGPVPSGGRNPAVSRTKRAKDMFGAAERLLPLQGQETGLRAISADEARNGDTRADDSSGSEHQELRLPDRQSCARCAQSGLIFYDAMRCPRLTASRSSSQPMHWPRSGGACRGTMIDPCPEGLQYLGRQLDLAVPPCRRWLP